MSMTFLDQCKQLIERFPQCEMHTARTLTWQAALLVYSEHPWSWAVKEGWITTDPVYNTGTANLTNGQSSVSFTGATLDPLWTYRKAKFEGSLIEYDITILTSSTATISPAWQGTDNAAATYSIFRDTYPVPADCDFGREFFLLNPADGAMVRFKDLGVFLRQRSRGGYTGGRSIWATRVGVTDAGVPLLRFGINTPSTAATYGIVYYAAPQKPVSVSLPITPLIPAPFEDLIWRRARWLYAEERGKNLRERDDLRRIYYERFYDAQQACNGGVEVERYIATIFAADRSGYGYELPWIEVTET